jgi:hypothetical protein
MTQPNPLTTSGTFVVGCNYWASHAGTAMWKNWQPDVVAQDLDRLAKAGLQVLRVFPLWPDFQPLTALGTGFGPVETRFGETPLPDDEAGRAGVSSEMMDRFQTFADLAEQHGLKLIVGLVTGWMSGRIFVPPALEGRNVLKDPLAIQWQTRLVQYFAHRFRDHPAILAWDLGNECNVMANVTRDEAWAWTSAIVNAIRAVDQTRPIVSGMHSLSPAPNAPWRVQDQGELTDVLTTHPYPYFTPYCDQDPVNTLRTELHSTAESRMYGDIGGRPALVEEIGTLGPMVTNEPVAADFIRAVLYSAWAHDCHGLLWWCAFDLGHLTHAPYDWDAYERELGLFHADGSPKPVLTELQQFRRLIDRLPFKQLPPRQTEAVCILSEGQDQWAVAYSSFILAKQAGFDITFQYADQPLKDASLYLLPCISGGRVLYRRHYQELLERVQAGATLYVSHESGMLSPFNQIFGTDVRSRSKRAGGTQVTFDALPGRPVISTRGEFRLELAPTDAQVLAREADGNPVFTCASYGKGTTYFLSIPLEKELTTTPGSFHSPAAPPAWQIWQWVARDVLNRRVAHKDHPQVGLTEHALSDRQRVLIALNYSPAPVQTHIALAAGWQSGQVWHGAAPINVSGGLDCRIAANDALVLDLVRE